jgi:hypothetical protein
MVTIDLIHDYEFVTLIVKKKCILYPNINKKRFYSLYFSISKYDKTYTAPKKLRILLFVNKKGRTGIIIDTRV